MFMYVLCLLHIYTLKIALHLHYILHIYILLYYYYMTTIY